MRFRDRLHSALSAHWACLAWVVCACSDGVGAPLVESHRLESEIGRRDAAVDAGAEFVAEELLPNPRSAAEPETDAGASAEASSARVCEELREQWPREWAREEVLLVQLINQLRDDPTPSCRGFPDVRPLEADPQLQCLARQRLRAQNARDADGPSSWRADRFPRAELDNARALDELRVAGDVSAQNVIDAIPELPNRLEVCGVLLDRSSTIVGVARSARGWVLDFGDRPSNTGPGGH